MNLIDCHCHSAFSFDGEHTVADMCETAVNLGIKAFSITDHCEVNIDKYFDIKKIAESIKELNALKSDYNNIQLIAGVELGQPLQNIERANMVSSLDGLDFIIGSLHNSKSNPDFYDIDYSVLSNTQIKHLLFDYYEELCEMATHTDYDVLGHLTYPFRYIRRAKLKNPSIDDSIAPFDELIYETLKQAIARGKGIEINTSGLVGDYGETFPSKKHIKMFFDLGGEVLSLGSDAHTTNRIGTGIKNGGIIAQEIGFKYVTYFLKRKPVMIKL